MYEQKKCYTCGIKSTGHAETWVLYVIGLLLLMQSADFTLADWV